MKLRLFIALACTALAVSACVHGPYDGRGGGYYGGGQGQYHGGGAYGGGHGQRYDYDQNRNRSDGDWQYDYGRRVWRD